jgi:O-antigen/teichoic acid export membrane protein
MFGLMLVLTHLMPMAEYGIFVLVVTTGEILDMGLGNWVRIFALRSESGSGMLRPRRLGRLIALSLFMTLLGLAVMTIADLGQREAGAFTLGVCAYLLAFAPHRLGLVLLQIRRKHAAYAAIEGFRACATVAMALCAAAIIGPRFLPTVLALAAATALTGIGALIIALRGAPRPQRARTGYASSLVYGLPIIVSSALGYSLGWLDRYVVDILVGPYGVAIFAATYALARQPIELFLGPVNNYAFPHVVQVYERDGVKAAGRAQAGLLTSLLLIGSPITGGLLTLAPDLLSVTLPENYRVAGAEIVPWMAVGTLLLAIKLFVYDNVFHLTRKTWLQPPTMVPAAIVSVGLGFWLIARMGVQGVGIAYCVAALVALATTVVVTARLLPMPVLWGPLARVLLGNVGGLAALFAVRASLPAAGPLITLVACALAYSAVYAGLLTMLGVSIRQSLETPWAPEVARRASPRAAVPVSDGTRP